MNAVAIITVCLSFIGVILIPALILMLRMAVRWSRIEMRLDTVVTEVRTLIDDKEKVHTVLFNQMREDRKATDRRLRWLEENIWNRRPNV